METMRSGVSEAIWSTSMPSVRLSTTGCAPPSAGWAHGHTAKGCSPHHSVVAIGTSPSASRLSCSVNPALTTRVGRAGMVVSPKACVMVTAPSAASESDPDSQAVASNSPAAPVRARNPRLLHCVCIGRGYARGSVGDGEIAER